MNNLILGDCRDKMHEMEKNQFDLVILDPFFDDANAIVDEVNSKVRSLLKKDGIVIWFSKTPHNAETQLETQKFFQFENEYVWHYKDTSTYRSKNMPLIEHEHIMVFHQGDKSKIDMESIRMDHRRPDANKQYKTDKCRGEEMNQKKYWEPHPDGNWRSSVIEINRTLKGDLLDQDDLPVGVKPVKLLEILVQGYTDEGDNVFDPFMGTGTTGVACQRLNRDFVGIEIEETYLNIAKSRLKQKTLNSIDKNKGEKS